MRKKLFVLTFTDEITNVGMNAEFFIKPQPTVGQALDYLGKAVRSICAMAIDIGRQEKIPEEEVQKIMFQELEQDKPTEKEKIIEEKHKERNNL